MVAPIAPYSWEARPIRSGRYSWLTGLHAGERRADQGGAGKEGTGVGGRPRQHPGHRHPGEGVDGKDGEERDPGGGEAELDPEAVDDRGHEADADDHPDHAPISRIEALVGTGSRHARQAATSSPCSASGR